MLDQNLEVRLVDLTVLLEQLKQVSWGCLISNNEAESSIWTTDPNTWISTRAERASKYCSNAFLAQRKKVPRGSTRMLNMPPGTVQINLVTRKKKVYVGTVLWWRVKNETSTKGMDASRFE